MLPARAMASLLGHVEPTPKDPIIGVTRPSSLTPWPGETHLDAYGRRWRRWLVATWWPGARRSRSVERKAAEAEAGWLERGGPGGGGADPIRGRGAFLQI
ncbi:hypothetical protein ZWY2020_025465 [Hordeum vulgare]|nr:hypothetical protein ZWY2020_025465 [Hordeum vulgare]